MNPDDVTPFERQREHLRAVAYRMLGSLSEADDAVQETWLRYARSDTSDVHNLGGWLTTVISRICLDLLRARAARREEPLQVRLPDPVVSARDDPEERAVLADSVGLALLVVLDTLSPAERLAFVLHDLFGMPFAEIGPLVERSPAAAKQLASRARRRVRDSTPTSADRSRQRDVVDAFLAAARDGDFERLLTLLDPEVVLRADAGAGPLGPSQLVRGPAGVTDQVQRFSAFARHARPVRVNGQAGFLVVVDGEALSLLTLAVRDGRIVEIDVLADPARLARLDLRRFTG